MRLLSRICLIMASGIPDVFTKDKILPTDSVLLEYSQLGFKISKNNTAEQNKSYIEKYIISLEELGFEPQSKFEYSNTNYFLLSRIIEKVSGETYEDFITENIFEPLDMKSSSSGYAGMNSTVDDLHKWISGLCGGKLLNPDTHKLMTATNDLIAHEGESYGFGLFTSENLCEHAGAWGTFVGQVVFTPDASKEIIYLSNYRDEAMYSVTLSALMIELENSIQN